MANAKQCDLCGSFYAPDTKIIDVICLSNRYVEKYLSGNIIERKKKNLPNSGLDIDICPNCAAAFKALYLSRKELGSK